MADQLYDFSEYYRTMTARAEINIDTSGLDIKSIASTDDGSTINEVVTNNVKYYIARIAYTEAESNETGTIANSTTDNYIQLSVTTSAGVAGATAINDYYIRVGSSMDPLIDSGLVEDNSKYGVRHCDAITAETYNESDMTDGCSLFLCKQVSSSITPVKTSLSSITVYYVPRYAMMLSASQSDYKNFTYYSTDDSFYGQLQQDQNFPHMSKDDYMVMYKQAMAALGFFNVRELSYKWLAKNGSKTSSAAVIPYDKLQKRLKFINSYINDADYGISPTYFDDNFISDSVMTYTDENGKVHYYEDATSKDYKKNKTAAKKKHKTYVDKCNEADFTRTKMTNRTKYSQLPDELNTFIETVNLTQNLRDDGTPVLDDISGLQPNGTGSALVPNVCDAFKAFYYDKDELATSLSDKFSNVLSDLYSLPILSKVMRKMSTSNRKALNSMKKGHYAKNTTGASYILDLNELRNSLYQVDYNYGAAGYNSGKPLSYVHLRALSSVGNEIVYTVCPGDSGVSDIGYVDVKKMTFIGTGGIVDNSFGEDKAYTHLPINLEDYSGDDRFALTKVSYINMMNTIYSKIPTDEYKELTGDTQLLYSSDTTTDLDGEKCGELLRGCSLDYNTMSADEIIDTLTAWYNEWFLETSKKYSTASFEGYKWRVYQGEEGDAFPYGSFSPDQQGYVTEVVVEGNTNGQFDGLLNCVVAYYNKGEDTYGEYAVFARNSLNEWVYSSAKTTNYCEMFQQLWTASLSAYLDQCAILIDAVCNQRLCEATQTSVVAGLPLWPQTNFHKMTGTAYKTMKWDDYVWTDQANDKPATGPSCLEPRYDKMMPTYAIDTDFTDDDCNMDFVVSKVIGKAIPSALSIASTYASKLNLDSTITESDRKILDQISDIRDEIVELMTIADRIRYYQYFTGESVFPNQTMLTSKKPIYNFKKVPARFMIPVSMYKKVKKKYKRFGFTRHKTVKKSIGVRWAEMRFIDTTVYSEYPQIDEGSYKVYYVEQDATCRASGNTVEFSLGSAISGDFSPGDSGLIVIQGADGDELAYEMMVVDQMTLSCSEPNIADFYPSGSSAFIQKIKFPLDKSKDDDALNSVRMVYNMPNLPYPEEVRKNSFIEYGPFDQSKYAQPSRDGNEFKSRIDSTTGLRMYLRDDNGNLIPTYEKLDGYRIFGESSNKVEDMRDGLGVHHALSMLISILKNEFGDNRVELIETFRSKEDEALECTGGSESDFLSWHNYGLAAKILIYQKGDMNNVITEDSDDMWRLIDVAEAFTEACRTAKVCPKPLNVVWCGRLVMGADNFVWEFLPIGVNHKDALKFREAICEQRDPVHELGFVDVDELGYASVYEHADLPYILMSSKAYKNAEIINGHHFVSPKYIRNYPNTGDLPLINVVEYIKMVELKMGANGTSLTDRANIYDWKALNDTSFRQLVNYYGMTGNISGALTLIGGDFVEHYQNIVDAYFDSDHVQFVKNFLGDAYDNVKIYIESIGDGGAYIMLNDGKVHVKTTDMRSKYDTKYSKNFFGERQTDMTMLERGVYRDGVFYTEDEARERGIPLEYVSDEPVISGYEVDNGEITVTGGDALLLHTLITTQIKTEYDRIRDAFENYGGRLMYDHFNDGPNAKWIDMVENEFGVIKAQDLMEFEQLRTMLSRNAINSGSGVKGGASGGASGGVSGSGTNAGANEEDGGFLNSDGNGYRYDSIYEKVVSNALLSGVRRASLTREHIQDPVKTTKLSVEELYRIFTNGNKITANDMLKRK